VSLIFANANNKNEIVWVSLLRTRKWTKDHKCVQNQYWMCQ